MSEVDTNTIISAAAIAVAGLPPTRQEYDSDDEFFRELRQYKATVQAVALEVLELADEERGLVGSVLANRREAAVFAAPELLAVEYEESSKRYKLTLRREKPGRKGEMEEVIRTNRKDDRLHGPTATRIANQAKRLIGHRVAIFKRLEKKTDNSGEEVRICEGVRDLGAPKD